MGLARRRELDDSHDHQDHRDQEIATKDGQTDPTPGRNFGGSKQGQRWHPPRASLCRRHLDWRLNNARAEVAVNQESETRQGEKNGPPDKDAENRPGREIREKDAGGKDERENDKGRDDGGGKDIQGSPIDPRPEYFTVIAEQQQK